MLYSPVKKNSIKNSCNEIFKLLITKPNINTQIFLDNSKPFLRWIFVWLLGLSIFVLRVSIEQKDDMFLSYQTNFYLTLSFELLMSLIQGYILYMFGGLLIFLRLKLFKLKLSFVYCANIFLYTSIPWFVLILIWLYYLYIIVSHQLFNSNYVSVIFIIFYIFFIYSVYIQYLIILNIIEKKYKNKIVLWFLTLPIIFSTLLIYFILKY